MLIKLSIRDYFNRHSHIPVIDVRSPVEFTKGHIQGAVNIPLFSDAERVKVGTVYVHQSKKEAIKLGYSFVTPKLTWFLSESKKVSLDGNVAVHCWRGGMRSTSFAEHLDKNGFQNVFVIENGYKAYRRHVLTSFENNFKLHILGGFTGSGKTHVLKELKRYGEQVVDLEALACHKGSAFGSMGMGNQPTVEQFENNLFAELSSLNHSTPIWMEDESHNIGKVKIPIALYRQMRDQRLYFINISKEMRAKHLVDGYSIYDNAQLSYAINGISKRLGGDNLALAHQHLKAKDYFSVALIALQYYDKAYRKGMQQRNQEKVDTIHLASMDSKINAQEIINFVRRNEKDKTHTI